MRPADTQAAKESPEATNEELEMDATRLHREIADIDRRRKTLADERKPKAKQLESVTRKLVTLQIAQRAP